MLNDGADVEELEPLAEELATDKDEEKAVQHVLWVEKYTPKYFTELLSDDVSTNNYVMTCVLVCVLRNFAVLQS